MTFSETLFMLSRGRRFYEIVGKYYLLKTSTEQIFYSDWYRRRSVKLYSCFPNIEGFMRLRANTLSAQIDGSEIGVGGTRQARQIRSICLSNMKIFLKVVNTQQVYLESDIQHLPMPHFWDIISDHITFFSLNDGSRESIALLYLLLFFMWNALSLWILYATAWLVHFENSKWISAPVQTMMTLCHPLVSISFWMSFNICPKQGAVIFFMTILNALYS